MIFKIVNLTILSITFFLTLFFNQSAYADEIKMQVKVSQQDIIKNIKGQIPDREEIPNQSIENKIAKTLLRVGNLGLIRNLGIHDSHIYNLQPNSISFGHNEIFCQFSPRARINVRVERKSIEMVPYKTNCVPRIGFSTTKKCHICGGDGRITIRLGFIKTNKKCAACNGRGTWRIHGWTKCNLCNGRGYMRGKRPKDIWKQDKVASLTLVVNLDIKVKLERVGKKLTDKNFFALKINCTHVNIKDLANVLEKEIRPNSTSLRDFIKNKINRTVYFNPFLKLSSKEKEKLAKFQELTNFSLEKLQIDFFPEKNDLIFSLVIPSS